VWSEPVYIGDISSMVTGSGMTKAAKSATLTLASGGEVQEVFVAAGDYVEEGQPLYTVESSEAKKAIEKAEETIRDYQKQLENINASYADLVFTAPFSGKLIDAPSLRVGDTVGAGQTIGTLVDDSTMKLSLYFSYAYENEFYPGRYAFISIPTTMETLTGRVETVNKVNRVSPEGSRLFEVIFSVPNSGTLTADMGATAFLTAAGGEEVYPYEPGVVSYNRSQELTTKAGGELIACNLLNYSSYSAGALMVQMKGDSNDDQIASIQESMKAAQEELEKAQKNLENYHAVAPISGSVLSCTLVPGEEVEANRVAVTIADTSVITVEAQIDNRNVAYVQPGMMVDITAWGRDGEMMYTGVVESVSMEGQTDENSGGIATFPAIIQVDNYDGSLRPNDYVDYSMVASESQGCLLAPVQAVKYAATGDTCLFVKADSAPENALDPEEVGLEIPEGFYAVPVTVGLSDQTSAEIIEGVSEGDEVFVQFMTNQADSYSGGGGVAVAVG